MSEPTVITVPIVTDGAGAYVATTPRVGGRFLQWRYVNHATVMDNNWDIDIVGATSGLVLVNQDNIAGGTAFTVAVRQPTHDAVGAASLYAAAGEPVEDYIWVNEALTLTIAQGGATKQGTIFLWFG